MRSKTRFINMLGILAAWLMSFPALAQKTYDPGVTDTEIKIGQTIPYSGPAAGFAPIGRAMTAYFQKINDEGGINGRKINLLSRDDSLSPPRAVDETRRMVENDGVWAIVGSFGSPTNAATQKYLHAKKIPSVLINSGAEQFSDFKRWPWSQGFQPNNRDKGAIYAKYILQKHSTAKVGVIYQNDDFGRDFLAGLRAGLGDNASRLIVKELSYEASDPTLDTQLVSMKGAGVTVLVNIATIKFTAQAIRKMGEMEWKPVHMISDAAASIKSVLEPAGLDRSVGVITVAFRMDPNDPAFASEPGMTEYRDFMAKYLPGSNANDSLYSMGFVMAKLFEQAVKQCGDNLTRANLMKQMTSMRGVAVPMLLPGITVNTTPEHPVSIQQQKLFQFDGKQWVPISEVLSSR